LRRAVLSAYLKKDKSKRACVLLKSAVCQVYPGRSESKKKEKKYTKSLFYREEKGVDYQNMIEGAREEGE
jgi:hypothetical protein